ncbi:hypothetical protein HOE22_12060, partial [Candidatus Woesearchaeota archaeon]|nr:hypothetical protein [Candidatus Woesearchaeota archaeon]MBT4730563.1 hypothetical protein [Candidatus Woesearchaeota archaeon]
MEAPKQKAENQLSEKDLEAVKESIRIEQEETKTRKREASDKELLEDGANYKVNEHGTRLDPTDKQFEEIRNSDERTRTKESSEAKENEPTEKAPEVFQNNQNRKDFEELNGAAKEVISNVYNNVKVGFIDRYKVVRDNKLYSLHKERVVELKEKVNAKKQDIEQIKANSKTHEIRVNGLRKQFGELSPKAEKEVTKEKKKLENALKDADLEETRLIAEQVFNEKKEKEYGEKRTEIINRIETFVDDKIEPYEAQADDLKEWVNELDQEINNFKGERDVFAKDLKEFRRKIFVLEGSDGGILASEKVMYDGKIKEIEKEIKEFDSSINLVEKEKGKTNSKINKLGVKIDYWKEVSRKAKEDGMPKPQEQPADTSEKESISSETEVKSEEKIENPEDNKEWFDAVMPSKESEDKYNKTKEWYEASGLSKKDMENVTNAEIKETTPEEKAGVEVNENSENNDES